MSKLNLKVKAVKTKSKTVCKNNQWGVIPSYLSRTLFVGSSGSGKSNLIYSLLSEKKFLKNYYDEIYVWSPNHSVDDSIKVLGLPDSHLYEDFDEGFVDELYEEALEAKKIHDGFKCKHPRVLFAFDDLVDDPKFTKSQVLKKLFFKGRHPGITVWIGSQYLKSISKPLRANAQHIILFKPTKNDIEIINEELNDTDLDKKRFSQLVRFATKNKYDFLNINRNQMLDKRYMRCFEQYLIPKVE